MWSPLYFVQAGLAVTSIHLYHGTAQSRPARQKQSHRPPAPPPPAHKQPQKQLTHFMPCTYHDKMFLKPLQTINMRPRIAPHPEPMKRLINYELKYDLIEGLKKTIPYYEEQFEKQKKNQKN